MKTKELIKLFIREKWEKMRECYVAKAYQNPQYMALILTLA